MASGLLVMLTGRATRLAELFRDHDKLYCGRVRFGTSTDTDDREGKVLARAEHFDLKAPDLEAALAELSGRRLQRAPDYSAVKVGGVPLYKQARRGLEVKAPLRPVRIRRLDLLNLDGDEAELEVLCSAGTYVRALARDLGEILGIPAHLASLRRLASGPYRIEDALDLAEIQRNPPGRPGLSVDRALAHLPALEISSAYLPRLIHGGQPVEGDLRPPASPLPEGSWLALRDAEGRLRGLARVEQGPEGPAIRLRRTLELSS